MSNETRTRVGERRTTAVRQVMRWCAVPALAIGGVVAASGPAHASYDNVPVETREVFDVLRLRCEGSDAESPQIACRWTMPDGAAYVKVLRVVVGSGEGRQIVHRTSDPSENSFVDSPVRRGVRYLYVVRAFDANGRLVAASRPAVAGVAVAPDPTVEALRLDCSATGAVTVRCRWTAPATPARVLTLWRSVDGGAREQVASFANPFPTSYGDVVPAASSRAVYAVIATDGAGEIVARSRAAGVAFPPADVVTRPVADAEVEPAPAPVAERDPEATTPSRPAERPAPAPTRPSAEIDEQRPVPTTSVPRVIVPAPSRELPADEPADGQRPVSERDGGDSDSPANGSDRAASSGERDRAG